MSMPLLTKPFLAQGDILELPCSQAEQLYRFALTSGSGTLTLEDSYDGGTTYVAVQVRDESAGTNGQMSVISIYTTAYPMVFVRPRVRCTAFTSQINLTVQPVVRPSRTQFPAADVTFTGAAQTRDLYAGSGVEGIWTLQMIGAGSLTVQVQDSLDGGVTPLPLRWTKVDDGTAGINITAAGIYTNANISALVHPRLAVSAFVSGNMRVLLRNLLRGTN